MKRVKTNYIRRNAIIEFRKFEFAGKTYEMDEWGNIKSLYKTATGFRKCFPDKDGYLKLATKAVDNKTHNAFIHRLVYQVWVGEIPAGISVDHIDNDKLNNHFSNLQLLTMEDNARKGNAKNYKFVDPDGNVIEVYNLKQFCKDNGLSASHMGAVHDVNTLEIRHKGWRKYYE